MIAPSLQRTMHDAFAGAVERACAVGAPILCAFATPIDASPSVDRFARWNDRHPDAFFWQARDPDLAMCGYGRAASLHAQGAGRFFDLAGQWRGLLDEAVIVGERSPLAIGGCRFDPALPVAEHWRGFGCADLAVPAVTLISDGGTNHLLLQRLVHGADDVNAHVDACMAWSGTATAVAAEHAAVPATLRSSELTSAQWRAKVEDVLTGIRQGRWSKVVLAREIRQHYAGPVPVATLLQRLSEQSGHAHVFAFARDGACFLGATPERLVRVEDGRLTTHALAGTTRRDEDPDTDRLLARALVENPKERHEHELVVEAIVDALRAHTASLDVPPTPQVKRLPRVQHLCSPITGTLADGVDIFRLLESLHPTPAVAGLPCAEAMGYLREQEGFDRGWYASPVGWVDGRGNGDFLVALRSALLRRDECRMYAGCGIVHGSDPVSEYRETALKLAQMREALETEPSRRLLADISTG